MLSQLIRSSRCSYSTSTQFRLKCGLEIHSQLNTNNKLFSLSPTSFNQAPNSKISFFDASLPGTQPKLNPEALLFALKAAVALKCDINLDSTFDRKHYFYGDQPLGYQITQHYNPIAKNGKLALYKNTDSVKQDKVIEIEQIQLEQDTGKSVYTEYENNSFSKIDLNRSNIPLIEMVTKPDFEDSEEVKIFIKKYQNLVRHLGICTGDLETGAMRIDVNISVNDNPRVELKNLSTTSAVISAIKYEYNRQKKLIQEDKADELIQETRGWDGTKTVRLRTKENSLDYRYMPDPELPPISLHESIKEDLEESLPELPDFIMEKLMKKPYNLKLKDATILTYDLDLLKYYLELFTETHIKEAIHPRHPGNWLIHELLGIFSSNNMKFDPKVIPVSKMTELLYVIHEDEVSQTSAKFLLQHIFLNEIDRTRPLVDLIDEYGLGKLEVDEADIEDICNKIIEENPKVVKKLRKKPNGLKFLMGRAMAMTSGRVKSEVFEEKFKELLDM